MRARSPPSLPGLNREELRGVTSREELDQAPHEGKKPTRFVEELTNENDYWMSLTDAARITRTSEPMVRRWVATGRLPVRKEPVGINQRTRLVRASDVSLIRPIVDPTAAITDDIHKLDLLSIPRQQEQIMHEQQNLLKLTLGARQALEEHVHQTQRAFEQSAAELQQQTQAWNHRLTSQQTEWQQALNLQQQYYEGVTAQVDQQLQEIVHRTDELSDQGLQYQQELASITEHFEKAHTTIQKTIQEVQGHLERLDQDVHQLSHSLTTALRRQEERFQGFLAGIEETLARHDQERGHIQQSIQDMQQEFLVQQETLVAQVEQQRGEITSVLEQRWSELAQERTAQREQMQMLEHQLKLVERQDQSTQQIWRAYQERVDEQDQRLQTLTILLHNERAARQSLSEHLTLQQEQDSGARSSTGTPPGRDSSL